MARENAVLHMLAIQSNMGLRRAINSRAASCLPSANIWIRLIVRMKHRSAVRFSDLASAAPSKTPIGWSPNDLCSFQKSHTPEKDTLIKSMPSACYVSDKCFVKHPRLLDLSCQIGHSIFISVQWARPNLAVRETAKATADLPSQTTVFAQRNTRPVSTPVAAI